MITSLLRFTGRALVSAVVGGLILGAAGCASTSNLLTYAQEAREKGLKQYQAGDYETAAGSFRSAVRQDPRDYKSFYYLGACYDAQGSYQQAAQAFQSSLKVMDVTLEGRSDKDFRAKTIDGLAIAVAKGQDRTASITMPQPGKNPAEDAWLRAKVFRYTGDADAAVENYTEAALQAPEDFYITKDFGLYLEALGQAEQADMRLRRAYRMNAKDQEVIAALRRVGTEPGPGLKERRELAKPPIPQGPLPEVKMPRLGFGTGGGSSGGGSSAPAQPEPAAPSAAAPRD